MADWERIVDKLENLLDRAERILPQPPEAPDWAAATAYRWRRRANSGFLQPVLHPHKIRLADLQGVAEQKKLVDQNTRQFVEGFAANNVLLTGAKGTGKSSLVKAVLNKFSSKGLRLIEVEKHDLHDLPDIVDLVANAPYRFVIFCDDLSFDAEEPGYKALKVVLDGSISATSDNVLIYATSNRRHLMPEYMQENLETKYLGEEIHPGESVEEKISLSERFGLWISFYPFDQDEYLAIVDHWVAQLTDSRTAGDEVRQEALQWALLRGSRSGRVAWQFARDWAGRQEMQSARKRK
ncbi:MAG: AAA family ATPase [Betaproteobacteria bacterium SG8_40]|jgi:predicted AAA+ superfamily ATPase|nr:MAG: AAA family ATPase [Betaproteobacteria bacterium SG8_40]